jgi:hypothetical protein
VEVTEEDLQNVIAIADEDGEVSRNNILYDKNANTAIQSQ